jgi:hypothetical protein
MGLCASSDSSQPKHVDGAAVLSQANLVPNPTLCAHIAGEDAPLGWQVLHKQGDNGAKWEGTKGIPHSGDRCLKIESKSGSDNAWFADMCCDPNTEYIFSGEIKCQDVQGGNGAYFAVGTVKGARTESVTGTHTEWKRYSVAFNSGELGVVRLMAVFGGGALSTGEAWYDTVDLVRADGQVNKEANLVPNYALHHGVDGKPYGWFSKQVSGAEAEYIWATGPGVARVGAYCLSIKADQAAAGGAWWSDIRVTPGKNYKFSTWIKSKDVTGGKGAYFSIANVASFSTPAIHGSSDYQQVTAVFNSGNEECIRLMAWFGPDTTGQAWYDDIEIVETATQPK